MQTSGAKAVAEADKLRTLVIIMQKLTSRVLSKQVESIPWSLKLTSSRACQLLRAKKKINIKIRMMKVKDPTWVTQCLILVLWPQLRIFRALSFIGII